MDHGRLEQLAHAGSTLSAIANEFGVSIATVRYWLDKHQLADVREASRGAHAYRGEQYVDLPCRIHGVTRHVLRDDAACYRCLKCRGDAVTRRRRRIKEILVAEAGGACAICGYDRCAAALQFHHLDPSQKAFGLSRNGVSRSLEAARAEAGKCSLLCSNCHAEVEAGFTGPP